MTEYQYIPPHVLTLLTAAMELQQPRSLRSRAPSNGSDAYYL
jgi:hypothetical protein